MKKHSSDKKKHYSDASSYVPSRPQTSTVQGAAVQSMGGGERSLLTKAVQETIGRGEDATMATAPAIGRGEDATMATAPEVARHQQVRAEMQGALSATAPLLGPKFDARILKGRVFTVEGRVLSAVLRDSPLAEEVAKHVEKAKPVAAPSYEAVRHSIWRRHFAVLAPAPAATDVARSIPTPDRVTDGAVTGATCIGLDPTRPDSTRLDQTPAAREFDISIQEPMLEPMSRMPREPCLLPHLALSFKEKQEPHIVGTEAQQPLDVDDAQHSALDIDAQRPLAAVELDLSLRSSEQLPQEKPVLTADEARAPAAAPQGLELVPSSTCKTGFNFETLDEALSCKETSEEALSCYARASFEADEASPAAAGEERKKLEKQTLAQYGAVTLPAASEPNVFMMKLPTSAPSVPPAAESFAAYYSRQVLSGHMATVEAAAASSEVHQPIMPRMSVNEHWQARPLAAAAVVADLAVSETFFKGVTKVKDMYAAHVSENGTARCLGMFETQEEASKCYLKHIAIKRPANAHAATSAASSGANQHAATSAATSGANQHAATSAATSGANQHAATSAAT
eukprot:jgi/Chrpa1/21231/Chrysochromulina_OHIO_Genome00025519-RA